MGLESEAAEPAGGGSTTGAITASKPIALTSGFPRGAESLLRGAGLIFGTPTLWPYVLVPMAIAAVAVALGAVGAVKLIGALADAYLAGWTGILLGTLRVVVVVVAYVAGILVAIAAAKVVVLPIAAAPFNEMLSERVEARVTGRAPPAAAFRETLRDALPAAGRGVATALYGLAILVISLPVLVIPVVGVALYLVPTAYVEALNALDVTFGRKRMSLTEKRAWMARRRSAVFGLGAAILLGNLIPLGAPLVVPAAAAGATLLVIGDQTP